jgi:hypothetical protein
MIETSGQAECRCETILSPQMEYVPGPHHDPDCPLRRPLDRSER